MTTIIISLAIIILILLWDNALMTFKIGYYEQTFKYNKEKFDEERYKNIENIMNKKSPF